MTHPTPETPETPDIDVTEVNTNPEATKPKKAWFKRPAFIVPVGVLVIAAGIGIPLAVNAAIHADRVAQYTAAVDATNAALIGTAEAEHNFPQALALYLAEYEGTKDGHFAKVKIAFEAPNELISEKTREALKKLHTEQSEAYTERALDEDEEALAKETREQVAAAQEAAKTDTTQEPATVDAEAELAVQSELVEPVPNDAVTQEVFDAQLAEQAKAEKQQTTAEASVTEVQVALDALDAQTLDFEAAITDAAEESVKNADTYLGAFDKAGERKTAAEQSKAALEAALADLADTKSTHLDPETASDFDYGHTHDDHYREVANVRDHLAAFITAAAEAKSAHQAAVDAEAAAAAAAANAETYFDSSGQTVANPNYVGYTSSGTWNGGGAASSGGTTSGSTPAPGGGGGGYVQAPIPTTPPTVANNGNYMPGCVNGGVVQSVNSPGGVVGAPGLPYDYYISGTTVYFLGCIY